MSLLRSADPHRVDLYTLASDTDVPRRDRDPCAIGRRVDHKPKAELGSQSDKYVPHLLPLRNRRERAGAEPRMQITRPESGRTRLGRPTDINGIYGRDARVPLADGMSVHRHNRRAGQLGVSLAKLGAADAIHGHDGTPLYEGVPA